MIFKNIEISEEDKKRICSNDIVLVTFIRILIEMRAPQFYPKDKILVRYFNFGTPEEELYIQPMFESTYGNWERDNRFWKYWTGSDLYDMTSSIGATIDPYLI